MLNKNNSYIVTVKEQGFGLSLCLAPVTPKKYIEVLRKIALCGLKEQKIKGEKND